MFGPNVAEKWQINMLWPYLKLWVKGVISGRVIQSHFLIIHPSSGFHRSTSWLHIYYAQAKLAPVKMCKIFRSFRPKMHFNYLVFLDCLNGLTFVCSDLTLFRLQWSYKHASMFWNQNMSTCAVLQLVEHLYLQLRPEKHELQKISWIQKNIRHFVNFHQN